MLRMAIGLTAVLAPLQLIIGDQHGLNTLEHQPTKIAAIEGALGRQQARRIRDLRLAGREDREQSLFDRHPACLVADPDPQLERTVPGSEGRAAARPAAAAERLLRLPHHAGARHLHDRGRPVRRLAVVARPAVRDALVSDVVAKTWWVGFVAVIAGWVVTESGRQPWIVQGILRTADAVSPVPAASMATTLVLFILVYGVVFSFGILFHQPADRARHPGRWTAAAPAHGLPPAMRRSERGRLP